MRRISTLLFRLGLCVLALVSCLRASVVLDAAPGSLKFGLTNAVSMGLGGLPGESSCFCNTFPGGGIEVAP